MLVSGSVIIESLKGLRGCFQEYWYPKMDGLYWKTLLKWMIWGAHPYFWKRPRKGFFLLRSEPGGEPPYTLWLGPAQKFVQESAQVFFDDNIEPFDARTRKRLYVTVYQRKSSQHMREMLLQMVAQQGNHPKICETISPKQSGPKIYKGISPTFWHFLGSCTNMERIFPQRRTQHVGEFSMKIPNQNGVRAVLTGLQDIGDWCGYCRCI